MSSKSVARTWRVSSTATCCAGGALTCLVHIGQPVWPALVTLRLLEDGKKARPGAPHQVFRIKDLAKGRATRLSYGAVTRAGAHLLEVALNGSPVVGSPLRVEVAPAEVHAPACTFIGMGRGRLSRACAGAAGEPILFRLRLRDRFANRCDAICSIAAAHATAIESILVLPGGPTCGMEAHPVLFEYVPPPAEARAGLVPECCTVGADLNMPGELILSMLRWRAGVHAVRVSISGSAVPGEVMAHVSPTLPHPESCAAEGPVTCIARSQARLALVARDRFGNAQRGEAVAWELAVAVPPVQGHGGEVQELRRQETSEGMPSGQEADGHAQLSSKLVSLVGRGGGCSCGMGGGGGSGGGRMGGSSTSNGGGDASIGAAPLSWRVETDRDGWSHAVYTMGAAGVLPVRLVYGGVQVRQSPLLLRAAPPILGLDSRRIIAGEPYTLWIAVSACHAPAGSAAARAAAARLRVSVRDSVTGEQAEVIVHDESLPGDAAQVEAAVQRAQGSNGRGSAGGGEAIREWLRTALYTRVSLVARGAGAAWQMQATVDRETPLVHDQPLCVHPGRAAAARAVLRAGWGRRCYAGDWHEGELILHDDFGNQLFGFSGGDDELTLGLRSLGGAWQVRTLTLHLRSHDHRHHHLHRCLSSQRRRHLSLPIRSRRRRPNLTCGTDTTAATWCGGAPSAAAPTGWSCGSTSSHCCARTKCRSVPAGLTPCGRSCLWRRGSSFSSGTDSASPSRTRAATGSTGLTRRGWQHGAMGWAPAPCGWSRPPAGTLTCGSSAPAAAGSAWM